jgi:hypothetical protein
MRDPLVNLAADELAACADHAGCRVLARSTLDDGTTKWPVLQLECGDNAHAIRFLNDAAGHDTMAPMKNVGSHPPPPRRPNPARSGARRPMRAHSPQQWPALHLVRSPPPPIATPSAPEDSRRAAMKKEDGTITANLGGGFRAVKMGGRWMIRFPDE